MKDMGLGGPDAEKHKCPKMHRNTKKQDGGPHLHIYAYLDTSLTYLITIRP